MDSWLEAVKTLKPFVNARLQCCHKIHFMSQWQEAVTASSPLKSQSCLMLFGIRRGQERQTCGGTRNSSSNVSHSNSSPFSFYWGINQFDTTSSENVQNIDPQILDVSSSERYPENLSLCRIWGPTSLCERSSKNPRLNIQSHSFHSTNSSCRKHLLVCKPRPGLWIYHWSLYTGVCTCISE